jgi:hypothetical protein
LTAPPPHGSRATCVNSSSAPMCWSPAPNRCSDSFSKALAVSFREEYTERQEG